MADSDPLSSRDFRLATLIGLRDLILEHGICPPDDVYVEASLPDDVYVEASPPEDLYVDGIPAGSTLILTVRFPNNGMEASIAVNVPDAKLGALCRRSSDGLSGIRLGCPPAWFPLGDRDCHDRDCFDQVLDWLRRLSRVQPDQQAGAH
jgi:hypothetical protein